MFKILKSSKISRARLGIINTAHGKIKTPCFMPDATRAVVRNIGGADLKRLGLGCLVVNTFHLYLEPGTEIIKKSGGVHKFMSWPDLILSDSGGYQVFSLIHKNSKMGEILERKVIFKSPLNGTKLELSPRKSIKFQFDLGADLIVCLDDCPPNDLSSGELRESVYRTIAWAKRCKREYEKQVKKRKLTASERPLLFSVIQGGTNLKLRKVCAQKLVEVGFDGFGFGARPVDLSGRFLKKVLEFTARLIPENSLRFGLGIGLPEDIVRSVKMGWDIFDCVIPTREGRHGRLFLFNRHAGGSRATDSISRFYRGVYPDAYRDSRMTIRNNFYHTINITNAKFARDYRPINKYSRLPELRQLSKAYLHHLFKIKEPLGLKLASLNNLEFYAKLMENIRDSIKSGRM